MGTHAEFVYARLCSHPSPPSLDICVQYSFLFPFQQKERNRKISYYSGNHVIFRIYLSPGSYKVFGIELFYNFILSFNRNKWKHSSVFSSSFLFLLIVVVWDPHVLGSKLLLFKFLLNLLLLGTIMVSWAEPLIDPLQNFEHCSKNSSILLKFICLRSKMKHY